MDAMCSAPFLLSLALEHPEMHVRSPAGALPTSGSWPCAPKSALPQFKAFPTSFKAAPSSSIFDADGYKAGDWVPLHTARADYPGGVEAFDQAVLGLLTIEPGESYAQYDT